MGVPTLLQNVFFFNSCSEMFILLLLEIRLSDWEGKIGFSPPHTHSLCIYRVLFEILNKLTLGSLKMNEADSLFVEEGRGEWPKSKQCWICC